ncbi:hypothetical protein BD779DRAFT_1670300 [Infundibulicybe gibba]|nr:hypothetical protein BD779DRAFT_1670300 [Infundibulicybe gibba]
MTQNETRHGRHASRDSTASRLSHSSSPPSQTHHYSLLPRTLPTPALVESVAGGAHYSGSKVEHDTSPLKQRRSSHDIHERHTTLKAGHAQVIEDLQELYGCRPTIANFEKSWHRDALFEDPLCKCRGFQEYAAQWFAMPKLFSHSKTISHRVMSSTHTPNRLVFEQTQEYTTRLFGRKKVVNSIISVDLDSNNKIIRVIDQWDGQELPVRYGAQFLRVVQAKVTSWIFGVPRQ